MKKRILYHLKTLPKEKILPKAIADFNDKTELFLKVLNFSVHTTSVDVYKDELQLRLVLRMLKVLQDVILESISC